MCETDAEFYFDMHLFGSYYFMFLFFFSGLGLAEISRIFKLCKPLLKVNRSGKNYLITITQTLP